MDHISVPANQCAGRPSGLQHVLQCTMQGRQDGYMTIVKGAVSRATPPGAARIMMCYVHISMRDAQILQICAR
jgi:hypothetical protein